MVFTLILCFLNLNPRLGAEEIHIHLAARSMDKNRRRRRRRRQAYLRSRCAHESRII